MPGTHTLRRGLYHSGTGMAQGAAGTKGPGGCQGSAGTADWKVGEIRRDEPCAGTLLSFLCLPKPSFLCPFGRSPASSGERLTIKADLKGARQTELPLYFAEIILTPK